MLIRRNPRPQPHAQQVVASHGDMAVVACHFNWCGFKRPVENLRRFLRHMEWLGVPVYGHEVAHSSNSVFITQGLPNWKHTVVGDECVLFQKEAIINHVVKTLPKHITKVAWVDADVEFSNKDVFRISSSMLDTMNVVQLFNYAVWTDMLGKEITRRKSCVLTGMNHKWLGHPGFAWAAKRDLFTKFGGLYSKTPVGHGDTVFACAATGDHMIDHKSHYPYGVGPNTTLHDEWRAVVTDWCSRRTGVVTGECWHMWHGDMANRKYAQRSDVLRDFDHGLHVEINKEGLLEWTQWAPERMRNFVKDYFFSRNEDTTSS